MSPGDIVVYTCIGTAAVVGIVFLGARISVSRRRTANISASAENAAKDKCWHLYVELETEKALKAKCTSAISGDTGIMAANNKLASILSLDQPDDFKAPRIIGQVCSFIWNMAVANGMAASDGTLTMPSPSPKLMDRQAFSQNIASDKIRDSVKYDAVEKRLESDLARERDEERSIKALRELLSPLKIVEKILCNEGKMTDEETVNEAKRYFEQSNDILKRYGY